MRELEWEGECVNEKAREWEWQREWENEERIRMREGIIEWEWE